MEGERQEIELKVRLVGRGDYERLCARLGEPDETREQVNHYFRSADGRIPGDQGVIRIRVEGGRAVLTVKLGGWVTDGLVRAREIEEAWQGDPDALPPPSEAFWQGGYRGMAALEARFGRRFGLVWAGAMHNRRRVHRTGDGLCLELDASRYPDGEEDFEVEVETPDPEGVRSRLLALLDAAGVRHAPQTRTKYQRFLLHGAP